MADCYFAAGDWAHVVQAYQTTPKGSLTYPDDDAQNNAMVKQFYQEAVAYQNLGDNGKAKTFIGIAYSFGKKLNHVPASLWSKVTAMYSSSGAKQRQDADAAALNTPEQHENALWAQQQGMSDEEVQLVKYRGKPCHIETFDGGPNYQVLTFWYCDDPDNTHYSESYTFTNGHQTGHYQP